ncbi:MAG TPA: hypothetical protein VGN63_06635 [Flavisolibacter sp.]|nr:hypothetical protein [Flavisolibacter sp.]
MRLDKGQPSGTNKNNQGTGVPAKFDKDLERDKELTQEYTDNDQDVAGSVRQNNPNRNTDKPDATNIGGYKQ